MNNRGRVAKPEELDQIYVMGFDVWSGDQDKNDYLKGCAESAKYAKGTWYVLEDRNGKPISSLIVYSLNPLGGEPTIGLGSIATNPQFRRQGHARQLIWNVLRVFHDGKKAKIAYLWSDIGAEFYRHLGFNSLPDKFQTKEGSILMVKCSKEQMDKICNDPDFKPPHYF